MIKQTYLSVILLAITLLTGCLNIEPALSGKAYRDYQNSIRPYIEYWKEPGMSEESREQDNLYCRAGGVTAGGVYKPEFEQARHPSESENETYSRLLHEWQRCMLKKGYQFTGKCYDNEIGRAAPGCKGRVLEPLK